ncbi:hypothetical protein M422DRAFT_50803 [Sphaerobolus stellatus SS14]|uniref:GST N-terminal domain-containing protein n=1 Tax=Sphaerobolus stellatus (strain SS14) TaxID=990650 RepID=A0A0C9VHH9_SPHS4|nr:hypothetical protein M422DRAFT_50803 [Sphaerobolus stellatus SS14]
MSSFSHVPESPIYYGYNGSPFVSKLEAVLKLKNIPARRVDVPLTPPRVDILALGIPYRRVPVLAIGKDVYIDTSLISEALEKAYPSSPILATDVGLQKAVTKFYDHFLFNLGFDILPWNKTPKSLQEDRKKFIGRPDIDFDEVATRKELAHSKLASHLAILEEHFSDGRVWYFSTPSPTYTDAGIYAVLDWIRSFRATRPVFDSTVFPKTVAWFGRLDTLFAAKPPLGKVKGPDAAKEIFSSTFTADLSQIGFDEVEAKRLGLKKGAKVVISPEDSGRDVVTPGVLIALSKQEAVIETEQKGQHVIPSLRVHFPRLGYSIREVPNGENAKL